MIETKLILEDVKNGKFTKPVMDAVRDEVKGHLMSTKRKGMKGLVNYLESSDFYTAPASTKFHGNYEGGLAVHSLLVYREFDRLASVYAPALEDETRKISALCHDICKVGVYKKNESKSGRELAKPYRFEDELPLGHGEKSLYVLREYIKPTLKEALLIRWHMGGYDPNYEMNSDMIKQKCPELVLLQSADRIVSAIYDI